MEREGENIDILMYKERKIMEDIEKACGKKTRRVDATSVHWKVGQQEKGSGNRTITRQSGIRNGLRQEEEEKV